MLRYVQGRAVARLKAYAAGGLRSLSRRVDRFADRLVVPQELPWHAHIHLPLRQLVEDDCFQQNTLLSESEFSGYCKDRGIAISWRDELEGLHRNGLLIPVLRIDRPVVRRKIIVEEDGRRYQQPLGEDEVWLGETALHYGGISGSRLRPLMAEGLVFDPRIEGYRSWGSYRRPDIPGTSALWRYSSFQAIAAHEVERNRTLVLGLSSLLRLASGSSRAAAHLQDEADRRLRELSDFSLRFERILQLLLRVQNAYVPRTRRDGVMITVNQVFGDRADWDVWCSAFDPAAALSEWGGSIDEVKTWCSEWYFRAERLDPISGWRPLGDLVSHRRKRELRGDALLAQDFYTAAEVLALFLEDLTDERHRQSLDRKRRVFSEWFGDDWEERPHEVAGYTCSYLGLHPEPRLVLYVEDRGLAQHLPRFIAEVFADVRGLGVEIRRLEGVGEINKKRLLRHLEYLVSRNILAHFIFDNENDAPKNWDQLRSGFEKTYSSLFGDFDQRVTTTVWESNFEFTNFDDKEIAEAVEAMSEASCPGLDERISKAREGFGRHKAPTLETVHLEAFGSEMRKQDLARGLLGLAHGRPELANGTRRPFLVAVQNVLQKAVLHSKAVMPSGTGHHG